MGWLGKLLTAGAFIALAIALPGAGVLGAIGSAAASIGISMAAGVLLANVQSRQERIERNTADPMEGLPTLYGSARMGLRLADFQIEGNDLYIVGALCHGSSDGSGIQAIDAIYFNDVLAFNAAGTAQGKFVGKATVTKYLGTDSQTVDPVLTVKFPTAWPSTSRGLGVAYVVIKLTFDADVFPRGIPNITAQVRGCKLYDPRDGTTAYDTNPILAIRDYLTSSRYGLGATSGEIDDTDVGAMATLCNVSSSVPDGGGGSKSQAVYSANGWLDTEQSLADNLQLLQTACRARVVYQGGTFRPHIRAVQAATSFALTEANIVGDFEYLVPGAGDAPNSMRYSFLDATLKRSRAVSQIWPRPTAANTYLTADNGYKVEAEIQLPFTNDPYMAEHLALVLLKEGRDGLLIQVTALEDALQLEVGDVVPVTHSSPGWAAKSFWVEAMAYDPTSKLVQLTLLEYAASAYSLDALTQHAATPNSNLPDPSTCLPPTGLTLASGDTNAEVYPDASLDVGLLVSWTPPVDPYVRGFEVQFKETIGGVYRSWPLPLAADTSTLIVPVVEGTDYTVQVRAFNTLGIRSTWATAAHTPSLDLSRLLSAYVEDGTNDFPGRRWLKKDGTGTGESVRDPGSTFGGSVLRFGGFSWWQEVDPIPIDPNRLYAVLFRVRQRLDPSSGDKLFYLGVGCYDAQGRLVNTTGDALFYTQHYVCAAAQSLAAGTSWSTYVGYLRGFAGGLVALTAGMLSQSGLGSFTAANLVDGDDATVGFDTDAAVPGAWLQIDLGSAKALCRLAVRLAGPSLVGNEFTVEYADASGGPWTVVSSAAATSFFTANQDWNAIGWNAVTSGSHRYWRLRLLNTPGTGPDVLELAAWERLGAPGATGSTPSAPATFIAGATSFAPLIIAGYPDAVAGAFDVDIVIISVPSGSGPDVFAEEMRKRGDQLMDSEGRLLTDALVMDGSQAKALVKGQKDVTGLSNGTAYVFPQPFQFTPSVGDWKGGVLYSTTGADWTTGVVPNVATTVMERITEALNLTAAGFTARLVSTVRGAATQRTGNFPTGANLFQGDTETVTMPAFGGSRDNHYTIRHRVVCRAQSKTGAPVSITIVWGIYSDDGTGSGPQLRHTNSVTAISTTAGMLEDETRDYQADLIVSGMGNADTFTVQVESITETNLGGAALLEAYVVCNTGGNNDGLVGLQFATATDNVATLVPSGASPMSCTAKGYL